MNLCFWQQIIKGKKYIVHTPVEVYIFVGKSESRIHCLYFQTIVSSHSTPPPSCVLPHGSKAHLWHLQSTEPTPHTSVKSKVSDLPYTVYFMWLSYLCCHGYHIPWLSFSESQVGFHDHNIPWFVTSHSEFLWSYASQS